MGLCTLLLLFLSLGSNRREEIQGASLGPQKQSTELALVSSGQESIREEVKSSSKELFLVKAQQIPAVEKASLGSIQGLFLDYEGKPLKKERLKIIRPGEDITSEGFGVYSDKNGYFSFADVAIGEWWIYWKPKRSETVTKLQSVLVEPGRMCTLTLILEGSRTLAGRVSFNDKWSPSLDQGGIQVILYPAFGAGKDEIVARGWAITDLSKPEKSGSFTLAGLRPDLYRLKIIPFDEGDYLELEIDLTQEDVKMEPVFIDPTTELIAIK